jgi:acetoacetyl-CoA synthetase
MTRFTRWLEERTGEHFSTYSDLHYWSTSQVDEFWQAFLDFSKIPWSGNPRPTLKNAQMPFAEWFPNLRLDFAEILLNDRFSGPAVVAVNENLDSIRALDPADLKKQVQKAAASLRRIGVGPGDQVSGYLSNIPEAVVACLATASLGAVWSSTSPDFGLGALADRLNQVQPKVVMANLNYWYGGKQFSTRPVLDQIRRKVPSIKTLVAVGEGELGECDLRWCDFLELGSPEEVVPERRPFATPVYVLFSSGTTGPPKCMIHGAGGTLLQQLKELSLHCNLTSKSRLLYFTTCGWMMWNWQLSALALGTTIFLYDGNPGFPTLGTLWERARELGITHLGTSGRYIESCMKSGFRLDPPARDLEAVLYTGSPLSPAGYRWVYRSIGRDVHLAGISGGTDIVSCFVLGNPNLPVHAGEIQCPGLGVDVAAFDDDGRELADRPGELVCRKPIPSMPLGFLGDPDHLRFNAAYFKKYLGIWAHGDFIEIRSRTGGLIIHGRSDATLNPGGVRIGAAEIYSALDSVPRLTGALAVGWRPPGSSDERIVLLVTLIEYPGVVTPADFELGKEIRTAVRRKASPRHVPDEIFVVRGLPVTRSGKLVELGVKAVLAGRPMTNLEALADPTVMEDVLAVRRLLLAHYPTGQ